MINHKIRKLINKTGYNVSKYEPIKEAGKKISFSQSGEDLIVEYVFALRGIYRPTYIDIGANHPYYLNNTAIFYLKGSTGINIEANPFLCNLFIKHRPIDINLNIGINDIENDLDFYIMKDNTLSTFSGSEFKNMTAQGKELDKIMKIKLTTFNNIIEKYGNDKAPDFMSIDVEGLDFKILQSINFFKYSPKIICVEAAEYSVKGTGAKKNELIDFLVSKNYYEYANTNLNAIMVKRDFWFI